MKVTLVLAGTFDQYRDFLRKNQYDRKDYKVVQAEQDLLGYKEGRMLMVGTWDRRPYRDVVTIMQMAEAHNIEIIYNPPDNL